MLKKDSDKILERFLKNAVEYKKLSVQTIILPSWDELGLLGKIYRQCVVTKENPNGQIYDELEYVTVMRILGGKLLIDGRVDAYTWKYKKIMANIEYSYPIGIHSTDALLNLYKILESISDETEKRAFADMMVCNTRDFMVVSLPEETRKVIIVNDDIIKATNGVICNEWTAEESCKIYLGDAIMVTDFGFYRIGKEEFLLTHSKY